MMATGTEQNIFDIVIIGAGPGGYCAAIRAAQLGLSTAIVEKRPAMGGTCLNIGCIPSKALLDSSEHFALAASGLAGHGVIIDSVRLDLAAMMRRKESIVATLTKGVAGLLRQNRVTVFEGSARFLAPLEVEVTGAAAVTRIRAVRGVIIATGGVPAPLPSLPTDGKRFVDSTGALAFTEVPERLCVVGGGAIGCELASVWARLGSKVTIVELMPQLLPGWDAQSARLIGRLLANQGMSILTESSVANAETKSPGIILDVRTKTGDQQVVADRVLVAVGRKPFIAGLDLDKIGISVDAKSGRIPVDKTYLTSCPGVYAIGDVIAGPMLAHKASAEGVAVIEKIAGGAGLVNYDAIPGVVYTSPEVASVGRSEEVLKREGTGYKAGVFFFKANGRALAMDRSDGFVKVLSETGTDRVLGVHIVGPNASDLIAQAVVVLEFGGSAEDIGRMATAHPTLSEVVKEAALDVEKMAIHAPPAKKN
jgi:dihydrolipoamide dehydrogenase